MNLKEIFGKNVKHYRFERKLTQEKLAALLDVSPNYISRLELGKHNPSLTMVDKLSVVLGIEPSQLFMKNTHDDLPPRVDMMHN